MENIFFYICIISVIISQILLLIQGCFNFVFKNDDKNIVEKTLFEQFYQEVYSSISTTIPINFEVKNSCEADEEEMEINLNLDTYYDCRGIFNSELNPECRNTIVDNYTTCSSDERTQVDFNNLEGFLNYDERAKYCQYFSKYKQNKLKLYNKYICKKNNNPTYEELLSHSVPLKDFYGNPIPCKPGYKRCGILDTKDNVLCIEDNTNCPINDISKVNIENNKNIDEIFFNNNSNSDSKVVSSIILSENQPLNHEWNQMVKETYNEIDEHNINKRKMLTKYDFGLLDSEEDYGYTKKQNIYITVGQIQNSIIDFNPNKYNINQKLNIYTKNYIGFKNIKELKKFHNYFKDKKDNPLYNLTSSRHDPIVTIVFSLVLLIINITYLVIIHIKNLLPENIKNRLVDYFIFVIICFIIGELIALIAHCVKYPIINIDMDYRMKVILDRYNNNIKLYIVTKTISLFFLVVSLVFISIHYHIINKQEEIRPN